MLEACVFISGFDTVFGAFASFPPWLIVRDLPQILPALINNLSSDYSIKEGIAIHNTARVEEGAMLKAPAILNAHSRVYAYAYLRGGVYMGEHTVTGPGCEVKQSAIMAHTYIAHFNYIGDSLIGNHVNIEAGAVIANHHNDRADKSISIVHNSEVIYTGLTKFGALIGDHCKIGANAVLSPGTILEPNSLVSRLALI